MHIVECLSQNHVRENRQNPWQTHQRYMQNHERDGKHLHKPQYGINITSILLNYLHSIGKQLIQAPNEHGLLEKK